MMADETDNVVDNNKHPLVSIQGIQPGPMRTRLRRRAFSGELEHESPLANEYVGTYMYVLDRVEPNISGKLWIQPLDGV